MKTPILILFLIVLVPKPVLAQDTISGYFTYQTEATERIGKCLDLRPDKTFTLLSIRYHKTTEVDSGTWVLNSDSLTLESPDSIIRLRVVSEYSLQTFLPDSIDPSAPLAWLTPTHWTKTRSYYQSGQVKSTMSWTSISQYQHDLIPHGLWITYYENGNLKEIGNYRKGRKKGKWYYLWPDGQEKNNIN